MILWQNFLTELNGFILIMFVTFFKKLNLLPLENSVIYFVNYLKLHRVQNILYSYLSEGAQTRR